VSIKAGQVLRFTAPKTGCRAFLAFAGGLDIPETMGSRSTYMKAKIGGFQGRKLEKGDQIGFRSPVERLKNMEQRRLTPEFKPQPIYPLRVVMGPQDEAFSDEGIRTFLSGTYTVTKEFDRMGCRLEGEVIAHRESGDIISDGIAFGAIQVPSAGQPIIMLADRQTTGGFPLSGPAQGGRQGPVRQGVRGICPVHTAGPAGSPESAGGYQFINGQEEYQF